MKVLCLLGSPRKNGNTSILLDSFIKGLNETSKADIENIFLHGLQISPCSACDACHILPDAQCVIKDDMKNLYPKIEQANVLVFATPVYWWNVSAQVKLFIDRLYAVNNLKCKKMILLMTYGGEAPNNGPELIEKTFREISNWLGIEFVDSLSVYTGESHVKNNPNALEASYNIGRNLK